jgi:hypothetical protein
VLEHLDDHPTATDPEPFAGPDHPIRKITRLMAFGGEWRQQNATNMADLFDGMAPEWSERNVDPTKRAPVDDGLDRGGLPVAGDWLELGSGTGAGARILSGRVGSLVCSDLSMGMLSYAPAELAPRVQADATTLPFGDSSFDAVLMINMILFPDEVDRIIRPGGAVLWVNTLGDQTPIHLPAADVVKALPGEWTGRTARAGTGFWLAATRAAARVQVTSA